MDADNGTSQQDTAIIPPCGISPQVRAVEREAVAVEREALAVERDAGGVVPPQPPTMVDLLAAAQRPVTTSDKMLAGLAPDAPSRAFVQSIRQQSGAIAGLICKEIEKETAPKEPAAPAAGKTGN